MPRLSANPSYRFAERSFRGRFVAAAQWGGRALGDGEDARPGR